MSREDRQKYWRSLVENRAETGMRAAVFCKEQKINPQQFYARRGRFSGGSPSGGR